MSDQPLQPVTDQPLAEADAPAAIVYCGNCRTPLLGDYCYRCGQSEKSMVRSLHVIGADLADLVFNVDSRIFRSLLNLYFRPGFLTTEYFAERRVRYVTPFRLFIFSSLIAFFVVQLNIDFSMIDSAVKVTSDAGDRVAEAKAAGEQVGKALREARNNPSLPPGVAASLEATERAIRAEVAKEEEAAAKRKEEEDGTGVDTTDPAGDGGATDTDDSGITKKEKRPYTADDFKLFSIGGKPWNRDSNRFDFLLLPDAADVRINDTLAHMQDNLVAMANDPSRIREYITAAWSVFPQTLFFLMPFFALLLKIVLVFKRRLYMEHLIVALHSHAFIFQSMLVITLLVVLKSWAAGTAPWLAAGFNVLLVAAWIWLPLYLLLMQKRVYRQGWFFGLLTYGIIGTCYTFLVSMGLVVAFAIALAA